MITDRLRKLTIERVTRERTCYAIGQPCKRRAQWQIHITFHGAPGFGLTTEVCGRHLAGETRRRATLRGRRLPL